MHGGEMEVKPGYKYTEVGVIPENWNASMIGEVATFSGGSQPPRSTFRFTPASGYIRLIQIRDYKTDAFTTFVPEDLVRKRCSAEDVMIGRYGPPVFQILRGLDGAYNVALIKVNPERNRVDKDFLYYTLKTDALFDLIDSLSRRTSGQTGVDMSALKAYGLALPPLPEQRTIATALSDMDALLNGLDRLIAKKRAIKQATMQQLLTGQTRLPGFSGEWEVKRMGEFTECTAGGTPSTLISSYWGGSIRWMNSGELNLKQVKDVTGRITEEGLRNSSTKMIPVGCVLVGLAGQGKTRGTVAMNLIEICTNQSIAAIFPNRSFVSEYLYYNLDSRYDELRDLSSGDGGRGGLNLTLIKSLPIPFPNVDEQAAIAAVLGDMDAEITALETRRIKIRALNQAMMQELLSGRTRLITPGAKSADEELTQTGGRKENVHFLRSVLAAEIIDQLHDQPTFGHVKFEKMMFLVEHLCEMDTGSTYHRKAAGPYDNRALRSIDSQLQKQQWFEARKQEGRYQYVPLAKRGGHKSYFDRHFSGIVETFEKILSTFKTAKTEQCEIVATLLAAWSDLLREKEAVSDEMIVHEVLHNWHEAPQRMSEDRWLAALGWMREKGFVPKGVALP